jgi:hypothetical protein
LWFAIAQGEARENSRYPQVALQTHPFDATVKLAKIVTLLAGLPFGPSPSSVW